MIVDAPVPGTSSYRGPFCYLMALATQFELALEQSNPVKPVQWTLASQEMRQR